MFARLDRLLGESVRGAGVVGRRASARRRRTQASSRASVGPPAGWHTSRRNRRRGARVSGVVDAHRPARAERGVGRVGVEETLGLARLGDPLAPAQ